MEDRPTVCMLAPPPQQVSVEDAHSMVECKVNVFTYHTSSVSRVSLASSRVIPVKHTPPAVVTLEAVVTLLTRAISNQPRSSWVGPLEHTE